MKEPKTIRGEATAFMKLSARLRRLETRVGKDAEIIGRDATKFHHRIRVLEEARNTSTQLFAEEEIEVFKATATECATRMVKAEAQVEILRAENNVLSRDANSYTKEFRGAVWWLEFMRIALHDAWARLGVPDAKHAVNRHFARAPKAEYLSPPIGPVATSDLEEVAATVGTGRLVTLEWTIRDRIKRWSVSGDQPQDVAMRACAAELKAILEGKL